MAKWQFGNPVNEMNYGELADELVYIVELAENYDVDVEAISKILDIIDAKYPMDTELKNVDESWAEFCEHYLELRK